MVAPVELRERPVTAPCAADSTPAAMARAVSIREGLVRGSLWSAVRVRSHCQLSGSNAMSCASAEPLSCMGSSALCGRCVVGAAHFAAARPGGRRGIGPCVSRPGHCCVSTRSESSAWLALAWLSRAWTSCAAVAASVVAVATH
jgi:hypothetical protein